MRSLAGALFIGAFLVAVTACSASTASPPAESTASPQPPPTVAPSDGTGPGAGGGSEPGGGLQPGLPGSELVEPRPGQLDVTAIPLEKLEAAVDGRTVTITASWSSGVEPCSVLDRVHVNKGDGTLDITIHEGTSDREAMCVLMLQAKHTVFALDLEPGTWVIRDTEGGAAPIEITVS